jgi:hypothetical protein
MNLKVILKLNYFYLGQWQLDGFKHIIIAGYIHISNKDIITPIVFKPPVEPPPSARILDPGEIGLSLPPKVIGR